MQPGTRNTILRKLFYAAAGIVLLFAADAWNLRNADRWKAASFRHQLLESVSELKNEAELYLKEMQRLPSSELFTVRGFSNLYRERGHIIQAFYGDSLVFWTSNRLKINARKFRSNGVNMIDNGWYYLYCADSGTLHVRGLVVIKNQYTLSNDYLYNSFNRRFSLDESVAVSTRAGVGVDVHDEQNHYICSLDFSQDNTLNPWLTHAELLILLLVVFFLLQALNEWIHQQSNSSRRLLAVIGSTAFLLLLKWIMVWLSFPHAVYEMDLFSPLHFASSGFLHSLGDLLILGLILLYGIYHLHQNTDCTGLISVRRGRVWFVSGAFILLYTIFFYFISIQMESLVVNSDISFDFHHITEITFLSFTALFTLAVYLAGLILLIDKHISTVSAYQSISRVMAFSLAMVVLPSLVLYLLHAPVPFKELSVLLAIVIIFILLHFFLRTMQSISKIYISILILSVFTTYLINRYSILKRDNEKKVIAAKISSERDPVAEYLLRDIDRDMRVDGRIQKLMQAGKVSYQRLEDILRNQYFFGYWNNFDLQIAICEPGDSLMIKDLGRNCNCHVFFDDLIREKGIPLDSTFFYYLNDHNGYISYLGRCSYTAAGGKEHALFIELDAKLNAAEIGYPALLLNTRQHEFIRYDYSYAKYFKGQLMMQMGRYHYAYTLSKPGKGSEYEQQVADGYSHLYYRPDEDYLVVISNSIPGYRDVLIMFSYICVFYFLIISLYLFVRVIVVQRKPFLSYYRNKILVAIVGICILALITLGISLSLLLNGQFKEKHNRLVGEKINAIYDYLISNSPVQDSNAINTPGFAAEMENVLVNASNIFYCDINLYSLNGMLMATSRPEVFVKKLKGSQMNPNAFISLGYEKLSECVLNERLGKMEYISAYTPVTGKDNKSILYLNVPYFARQAELQDEISNVIISVVNISVIIIMLAVIIAFIITNTLTYPLQLIQSSFSRIKLSGKNEKIEYNRHDELGRIVESYNNMVEELDRNIQLLARTERESAWREMAKQVAHEIKNPLTPMKLGIQQLQRALAEGKDRNDEMIRRLSDTLIEQIDNLSSIAAEFSNFAKMPAARIATINLVDVLNKTRDLFNNKSISITVSDPLIKVDADMEQLQRVFLNLVTNAIQAMPDARREQIDINANVTGDHVLISVSDNGMGVDSEMQAKLFQPNFTTKSSGSGLGLSIVKNILENINGTIRYSPNPSGGSVFIIELPLARP